MQAPAARIRRETKGYEAGVEDMSDESSHRG
jgi:hypothetical protein